MPGTGKGSYDLPGYSHSKTVPPKASDKKGEVPKATSKSGSAGGSKGNPEKKGY